MCDPLPQNLAQLEDPELFIEVNVNDLQENNIYFRYTTNVNIPNGTIFCIRILQILPNGFMVMNPRNNGTAVFRLPEFMNNCRLFKRLTEEDKRFNKRANYLKLYEGTSGYNKATKNVSSDNYLMRENTLKDVMGYMAGGKRKNVVKAKKLNI